MKVKVKTAHGYLSFQPDGRLEYRPVAGPWEEIDLEGLTFEAVPGPGPALPVDDVGQPTAAYVRQVKDRLQAAGVSLTGACGAFEITKRVAWDLRHSGAGLLAKPGGNNCQGYATDIVAFKDRAFDILSDGGNTNGPIWSETDVDDLPGRWRPAVQP